VTTTLVLKKKNKCKAWHKIDATTLPFSIIRKWIWGGNAFNERWIEYPYRQALTTCLTCGKTITVDEYGRLV
jgi:hypothetical protein